ncbi:hypothetical protein QFZ58_006632 [Streptomyces sp. B1I3]|nr:hypothetical protein [Streptomyces sp. B1I3]
MELGPATVLDGEAVVWRGACLDFGAVQSKQHHHQPRARTLTSQHPLLGRPASSRPSIGEIGDTRGLPYTQRRELLWACSPISALPSSPCRPQRTARPPSTGHHEVTSRTSRAEESSALGIMLTFRRDGRRPWDTSTVHVHGDLELPEEDLRISRALWNHTAEDSSAVTQDRDRPLVWPREQTGYTTVVLRCSTNTTFRHTPRCRPIHSWVPIPLNPARAWTTRLAAFSGKIPDRIVQIPAASVGTTSSGRGDVPAAGVGTDVDGALDHARTRAPVGHLRRGDPAQHPAGPSSAAKRCPHPCDNVVLQDPTGFWRTTSRAPGCVNSISALAGR